MLDRAAQAVAVTQTGTGADAHWFWRHFGPLRARMGDIVLASGVANMLALGIALFALQVYDRVVPHQHIATLWALVAGVVLAIALECALRLARAQLIDSAAQNIEIAINRDLFDKLLHMRLEQRCLSPAATVSAMREFAAVKEFFAIAAAGIVADLPFVILSLGLIMAIAGPLVWLVVAGAAGMLLLSLVVQRRVAVLSRDLLDGAVTTQRLLADAAYGLETIRSTGAAGWFQRQWDAAATVNARASAAQRRLAAMLAYGAGAVQMLTYVAVVTAGVLMLFADRLTVGGIIAVSILTSRTLAPIVQLSAVMARWQNATTARRTLGAIAQAPQVRFGAAASAIVAAPRPALRLCGVRGAYPGAGGRMQISIADLDIAAGGRLGVLGENGAGKSLMLCIMAGLYAPMQGRYLIDGHDARTLPPAMLHRLIGYVPQDVRLFHGTLRDNLLLGGDLLPDARLQQALAFGGLGATTPDGPTLDSCISDGGGGLSVGQRAAVGLARLHLQDPAAVLLDEPTAAMDTRAEAEFVIRLQAWLGTRTAVICTHRAPVLAALNDVVVLAQGRIVAQGPKQAVLATAAAAAPVAPLTPVALRA